MNYTGPAVEISDLRKTYANGQVALSGISLSVKQGEFFGLLGPNGAGKSTLINILAGITAKTSGSASVLGHEVENEPMITKRLLGVVPQELSFDHFFNVDETLRYQSGYFGIRDNSAHIDELLTALNLTDKRFTNTRALSGGMKRRLLVAKSMVHQPPVLILDEPTAGVDVELRQSLYAYVRKINQRGVTVLLTTHYLEEAEELCDRIAIIDQGKLVALDTTQHLLDTLGTERSLVITLKEIVHPIPDVLREFHPKLNDKTKELYLHFSPIQYERVLEAVAHSKLPLSHFRVEEENLEAIFLKLTSRHTHAAQ